MFTRRKEAAHSRSALILPLMAIAIQFLAILPFAITAQLPHSHISLSDESLESAGWYEHTIDVQCTQDEMVVSISPKSSGVSFLDNDLSTNEADGFSGTVYPRGLGRAAGCLARYRRSPGPVIYRLPLRACNTMPFTLDDGTTEYRNVLMVQPHPRLVTGRGKSHEVSCKPPPPPARNVAPIVAAAPRTARLTDVRPGDKFDISTRSSDKLPACTMKIYKGGLENKEVATNVKIGDPLTLVISLDKDVSKHGLRVTDCTVKDGLGWAQQNLVNDDGCPLDNEIMGMFDYSTDGMTASVTFQAHKFPYTPSVYYQCSVKLCTSEDKELCGPACNQSKKSRKRRQNEKDLGEEEEAPAKIEVFSGLYVNEATDVPADDFVTKEKNPDDAVCISQRNFAIAICIAGLILMLAVVAAILVILAKRRGPKSVSNTGSSIYSGPYTNTGYSHTS